MHATEPVKPTLLRRIHYDACECVCVVARNVQCPQLMSRKTAIAHTHTRETPEQKVNERVESSRCSRVPQRGSGFTLNCNNIGLERIDLYWM